MNIYAKKGHKVKCTTFEAGYDSEQKVAKQHLEIGKEYTIERTEVNSWYTDVWLQEFPGIRFNSVFFENAVEPSNDSDLVTIEFISPSYMADVKLQQEKMYSEKEVIELLMKMNSWPTIFEGREDITEWFEDFKKK